MTKEQLTDRLEVAKTINETALQIRILLDAARDKIEPLDNDVEDIEAAILDLVTAD